MNDQSQMGLILDLSRLCAPLSTHEEVLGAGVPILHAVSGARTVLVMSTVGPEGPRWQVVQHHGCPLDPESGVMTAVPESSDQLVTATVPGAWAEAGVRRVAVRRLAQQGLVVVLAWANANAEPSDELQVGFAMLDSHLARTDPAAWPTAGRPADMGEYERRQALEINDNVIQGLVAATYALDQGLVEECTVFIERTLSTARAMMDSMLVATENGGFAPGTLVRSHAATLVPSVAAEPEIEPEFHRPVATVLVVDDADDLRRLMRSRMESRGGLNVVGEAADGLTAVELASQLQPDLVLLDLAMPHMDGLEALPLIRAAVPGVRVIVLSGFNQSTMAEKAIAAGADEYVVKGGSMRQLLELVDTVLAAAS